MIHPMQGIVVYRLVETTKGVGIVTSFNRIKNEIDVATLSKKIYGLRYEDVKVIPLILKGIKI